jgi:hypothetical protein
MPTKNKFFLLITFAGTFTPASIDNKSRNIKNSRNQGSSFYAC